MTIVDTPSKSFQPGTTGWTASDLDNPRIEHLWLAGRYEIVEGVLTTMPPAYFVGGNALFNLMFAVKAHLQANQLAGRFSSEVDVVTATQRVARADAVMLTPAQEALQAAEVQRVGKADGLRTRILVPPELIIESVSPGHEAHDRGTKTRWYAEFGVQHYWILDAFTRSIECLVRDGGTYRVDQAARNDEIIRPSAFPGLALPLRPVWLD